MLGLGLGLNRGGVSSEGLSLDLQFATDLTLTARKGPTPSFTRGTSATEVGPDKLIRYAPENLLVRSQDQSNLAAWPALNSATRDANSSIGLDGTQSATKVIFGSASSSLIFQGYTHPSTVNTPLTFSVWVSSANAKKFRLAIFGASQVYSDVITPTPTLTRYSFTVANTNAASISVVIANESAGGVGEVVIWGAQLERHTSARAYIPTTTGAVYGPRFDHDPSTGQCKGLLIEEERRNFLARSEEFGSATWVKTQSGVSVDTATSPSGSMTADTLIEDGSVAQHYVSQQITKAASSITYAFSVYYKNASGTRNLIIGVTNGTSAGRGAIFTTNGSVAAANVAIGTGTGFTITSAYVENVGDGWYRASVTVSSDTATRLDGVIYLSNSSSTVPVYTGDGTSGIFLWGAQLEAGAFATSYIPTAATVPLTRSADVCSITGTDFSGFYNQSEGSFAAIETTAAISNPGTNLFHISDGTTNNRMSWRRQQSTVCKLLLSTGGVLRWEPTLAPVTSFGVEINAAFAYKAGDYATASAGVIRATDAFASTPAVTRMDIGSSTAVAHIKSIRYYRKRLSNAKLQALTAP